LDVPEHVVGDLERATPPRGAVTVAWELHEARPATRNVRRSIDRDLTTFGEQGWW
jgi:hypothetical protein